LLQDLFVLIFVQFCLNVLKCVIKLSLDTEILRETVEVINDYPSTGEIIANMTQQCVGAIKFCRQ